MPVPLEIRQVPRPKNTVVIDSKSGGQFRYAVLERRQSVCKPGRNPSPRNGKTIGHIIDGKYVPCSARTFPEKPEWLAYGAAALAVRVQDDILPELRETFGGKTADAADADTIFVVAALKVLFPGIADRRIKKKFEETFLCRLFPNVDLSQEALDRLVPEEEQGGLCPKAAGIARREPFLDRVAASLAARMEQEARALGALEERSFRELLEDLGQCLRSRTAPEDTPPDERDRYWENVTFEGMELMKKLELVSFWRPQPKRRRGRPPAGTNLPGAGGENRGAKASPGA